MRVTPAQAEAARLARLEAEQARRHDAATTVQAVVRGRAGRKLRRERREQRDAAMALQRVVRGRHGRQRAEDQAMAVERRPVLCVGQRMPVEGGGSEYVVTRVMWRRDKRKRVVVNSMKVGWVAAGWVAGVWCWRWVGLGWGFVGCGFWYWVGLG